MAGPYNSFAEFYPFYLSEHENIVSRRLHVVGTSLALVIVIIALASQNWWLLLVALLQGYAFAWVGHFFSSITNRRHLNIRSTA